MLATGGLYWVELQRVGPVPKDIVVQVVVNKRLVSVVLRVVLGVGRLLPVTQIRRDIVPIVIVIFLPPLLQLQGIHSPLRSAG